MKLIMGCTDRLHILFPLFDGVFTLLGVLTTYGITISYHHASALMPSISLTGIKSPEKFVFSQVLNIAAALGMATFVLRYKMLKDIIESRFGKEHRCCKINVVLLCFGCLGSIGLSMVANCQYDTAFAVHTAATIIVFTSGGMYMSIDTYLRFKTSPKYTGCVTKWLCLITAVIGKTSAIVTFVTTLKEDSNITHDQIIEQKLHWPPELQGYTLHLVSNFAEWLALISFTFYIFLLVPDFYNTTVDLNVKGNICLSEPEQELINKS